MLEVATDLGHTPTLHLLDVARIKRNKKQRQNKECNSDRQKDAHLVLSKTTSSWLSVFNIRAYDPQCQGNSCISKDVADSQPAVSDELIEKRKHQPQQRKLTKISTNRDAYCADVQFPFEPARADLVVILCNSSLLPPASRLTKGPTPPSWRTARSGPGWCCPSSSRR
jgi:hypothetical protein